MEQNSPPILPICCGDPGLKPATFTRFVLPFAYDIKLKPKSEQSNAPPSFHYEKLQRIDEARRDYFTVETGKALFDRATWLRLKKGAPGNGPAASGGGAAGETDASQRFCVKSIGGDSLPMIMSPPQVVLFELPLCGEAGLADVGKKHLLGVGFLIVETYFRENDARRPSLDDLLRFNELFRYYKKPFDEHPPQVAGLLSLHAVCQLTYGKAQADDLIYSRWSRLLEFPFRHDGSDYGLVSKDWDIYADNRLFVWACAVIEGGGEALRNTFKRSGNDSGRGDGQATPASEKKGILRADDYGHWIKLLNVDLPARDGPRETDEARDFERVWARERTYHRWEELGTFYGFNYHSGALLAPYMREPTPLWKHFGQMYFDMAILLLYIRIALFRFSRRLYDISAGARSRTGKPRSEERWRNDFESLRWDFTLFTNLYQFPLISNQQQGVEMYACARKFMDVDDLYREVEKEINTSHEYLEQRQQRRQSETTTLLTVVATFGLAISVAFAFVALSSDQARLARISSLFYSYLHFPFWASALAVWVLLSFVCVMFSRPLYKFLNYLSGRPAAVKGWSKKNYRKLIGRREAPDE
jgi:hypothetical protein